MINGKNQRVHVSSDEMGLSYSFLLNALTKAFAAYIFSVCLRFFHLKSALLLRHIFFFSFFFKNCFGYAFYFEVFTSNIVNYSTQTI